MLRRDVFATAAQGGLKARIESLKAATFRRLLVRRTLVHGSQIDMRILSALRDREFRLARVTRALALAAALVFAFTPAFATSAMAGSAASAPPGFMAVCTAQGVAYIPVDASFPADAAPAADHGARCLHFCCVAQTTTLVSAQPSWSPPVRWNISVEGTAAIIAEAKPGARPLPRGPPAA